MGYPHHCASVLRVFISRGELVVELRRPFLWTGHSMVRGFSVPGGRKDIFGEAAPAPIMLGYRFLGWDMGSCNIPLSCVYGFWISEHRLSGIVGGNTLVYRLFSAGGIILCTKNDYETEPFPLSASIQPCGSRGCVSKRS